LAIVLGARRAFRSAELSNQPEYEVRTAALPVEGERDLSVWYLHHYATGDVDLIAVTNR